MVLLTSDPPQARFGNTPLAFEGNAVESDLRIGARFHFYKCNRVSLSGDEIDFPDRRFEALSHDPVALKAQRPCGEPLGAVAFAFCLLARLLCRSSHRFAVLRPWHRVPVWEGL